LLIHAWGLWRWRKRAYWLANCRARLINALLIRIVELGLQILRWQNRADSNEDNASDKAGFGTAM
jgi:hypothetical protein